jgi:putative endonuclease
MSKHSKIGIIGEEIASNFLLNKGYKILFRNWRYGNKEVDIIAEKNEIIVFVEVKTRRNTTFGFPEEAVTSKKRQLLFLAAQAFIEQYTSYSNIQFDIISVALKNKKLKDSETEIVHYEDAFYGNN